MKAQTLQELLLQDLRDLYDAEKQLVKALPRMAKTAANSQVEKAISDHLEVTKEQVNRLEKVFEILGEKPKGIPCRGMQGLIEEGDEHMSDGYAEGLLDSVVVGSGQKIEHYEIAGYSSAIELADMIGNRQASRLLQQTLNEEERMSKKLTQVSGRLLKQALHEEQKRAA